MLSSIVGAALLFTGSALAGGPSQTARSTVEMVSTAWYAGWHASDFPLSNVSWDKYTQMTYAFAVTVDDPSQLFLNDSDKQLLPQFVDAAHKNGVKASLSLGGWTGSRFFSTNVGSAENRTQFVKAVTDIASKYNLDGIDIDWEYPNRQGIGCNAISPNDTSNLLSFLQELRTTPVGKNLVLSTAVSLGPFVGFDGNASTDVSAFAKVIDFIEIMDYDVWGSWSTAVGPNAPLNDTCAPPADQQGSAVSAIKAWTTAGMPASQIVLGVPSYGHSFNVSVANAFGTNATSTTSAIAAAASNTTTLVPYPAFNASNQPVGDAWDSAPAVDVCGVLEPQGGIFDFWGLIAGGFLNAADGSVAPGIASRFDECSQTAYVYNPSTQVMVSYDSPQTFVAKGEFIKNNNLRGFAMWEAGGDSGDILLDAILQGAGLSGDSGCDDN